MVMQSIITNSANLFFSLILFAGCNQMSEMKQDASAGFNGGFEVSESDLPVNWLFYTAKTVGYGDFQIRTDNTIYKEGKQSLHVNVKSCTDKGGRFSPGCAAEINAVSGKTYILSFWAKNSGTTFSVSAGAIKQTTGLVKPLLKTNDTISEWKRYEYAIDVPKDYSRIRVELSVLSPGSFWVDDVKIEPSDK